jgi:hypothetical protein
MKQLKTALVALALVAGSAVFAINPTLIVEKNPASTELKKMLNNPEFIVESDMEANVLFTINEDKEIIILSVDTDNRDVERYVFDRLSNEELDSDLQVGKQYIVPIKIKSVK